MLVVLYGCETWSLTLREEHRLHAFENWLLRRIFGLKGEEATEEWIKLHNEEISDLYCSLNVIGVIKSTIMILVGHVARMGEWKGVCRGMVGKHEGKRPLGRPSHRREDNFKMDL